MISIASQTPPEWHISLWATNKALGVFMAYSLGAASWHFFEKYFLRLKVRFEAG